MLAGVWKQWLFKKREAVSKNRKQAISSGVSIPGEIQEVIQHFFCTYDNFQGARNLQTDTFIKEVFYATKQEPMDQSTVEEMETYLHYNNMQRLRLKHYEIDEFLMVDSDVCLVGVTREYSGNVKNRVLYFLHKEDGGWRFHHIARSHYGVVLDKFQVREQTGFVIGNEKAAMLFLTHSSSSAATNYMTGDYVHAEGYLEVEQQVSGQLFYRVVRMNRIH
ncbi:hypothetical protein [Paenibacillus hexagrammi]|uniref:SnoaL-like domain-containing protein n=1 Tax=Paenibacillus hexagrammi TaxID=2908839 RepID=A0ABY3SF31_9BACL|nr:hypothetical protein [Paenibacillus sp. YPD9-1]UJF32599.1 hypothetical protein L0M14_23595 [Paenibacillus sp. YPD9-1]